MKKPKLRSVLRNYRVCQSCGIVDKDNNRDRTGYPCPNCKTPSTGGLAFFNIQTQMLVNLIEDVWEKRTEREDTKTVDLTIIIFYCTLQEILMQALLESCMWANSIPEKLIDKILTDNMFISKRVDNLFPVLTNLKFSKAVPLSSDEQTGKKILEVWDKAIKIRNNFMHRGDRWNISEDFSKDCWSNILPLCELFVSLTNKYASKTKI